MDSLSTIVIHVHNKEIAIPIQLKSDTVADCIERVAELTPLYYDPRKIALHLLLKGWILTPDTPIRRVVRYLQGHPSEKLDLIISAICIDWLKL